jgi:pentatricopeptide repeat protein
MGVLLARANSVEKAVETVKEMREKLRADL